MNATRFGLLNDKYVFIGLVSILGIGALLVNSMVNNANIDPRSNASAEKSVETLYPEDDTYVDSERPDASFGSEKEIVIDSNPMKVAYLKFDLKNVDINSVEHVQLHVWVTEATSTLQDIKVTANSVWSEGSATYASRPKLSEQTVAYISGSFKNDWAEADFTKYIQDTVPNELSFAIIPQSSYRLAFASRESDKKPYLTITHRHVSAPKSTNTPKSTPTPTALPTPVLESEQGSLKITPTLAGAKRSTD